jgi:hypothetical protein
MSITVRIMASGFSGSYAPLPRLSGASVPLRE